MQSADLAGTLPADLPLAFTAPEPNGTTGSLHSIYLSNNSIVGSLPAQWGDDAVGWRWNLERLYLFMNSLSGSLPASWSDASSLYRLSRVDLYQNQLTGPITWTKANLPNLGNLVLQPGKHMHVRSLPSQTDKVIIVKSAQASLCLRTLRVANLSHQEQFGQADPSSSHSIKSLVRSAKHMILR